MTDYERVLANADGTVERVVERGASTIGIAKIAGADGNPNDSTHPLYTKAATQLYKATVTFTPAAAAYSAGDVIEGAKAFSFLDASGNAAPVGGYMLLASSISIVEDALISGETTYNLETYNVTPPSAFADNAAWSLPSGDDAAHRRTLALGTFVDKGAVQKVTVEQINAPFLLTANGYYGYLVTVGGFTATAAARTVTLYAVAL